MSYCRNILKMPSTVKINSCQIDERCLSTKIYVPRYASKINPRKYIFTKEARFTVVIMLCDVYWLTIFILQILHILIDVRTFSFRDIFSFMFGSPGWINIKLNSFGSLLSLYLNKLFFESALKLKL